jgi:hypothetical protein
MTLTEKYESALQYLNDYADDGGDVREEDGLLHIRASVATSYERDVILEKIHEIGGEQPPEVDAMIDVRDPIEPGEDVDETGETLQRAANRYYPRSTTPE